MPRKLSANQRKALDAVFERGDATIAEVAEMTGMPYGSTQQALSRLADRGAVRRDLLGDGTRQLIFRPPALEQPDSSDPLERVFAAPAADRTSR